MQQQDGGGHVQTWVVVMSDGQNYIGILDTARWKGKFSSEGIPDKEKVLLALEHSEWITLLPAYEFYCPMGQDPNTGQFKRSALLTHPDFFVAHKKVPLHLRISRIYFVDDLSDADQKKYKEMIAAADKTLEKAEQASRAQAANLALVPASALPDPRGHA